MSKELYYNLLNQLKNYSIIIKDTKIFNNYTKHLNKNYWKFIKSDKNEYIINNYYIELKQIESKFDTLMKISNKYVFLQLPLDPKIYNKRKWSLLNKENKIT